MVYNIGIILINYRIREYLNFRWKEEAEIDL